MSNGNWKATLPHKEPAESQNGSFESEHSHSSATPYHRFQLNRNPSSAKKEQLFAFSSRPKESSRSNLTQRNDSKILLPLSQNVESGQRQSKDVKLKISVLVKKVRQVTQTVREIFEFFSRTIAEMQEQWEKSYRELMELRQEEKTEAQVGMGCFGAMRNKLERLRMDSFGLDVIDCIE